MTEKLKPDTTLDRSSGVPLYRQLADDVRRHIVAGTYPVGSALPTERAMIAAYDLSRVAVRLAMDVLAREGLIVRRRGKGTYVTRPRLSHDLTFASARTGFYGVIAQHGGARSASLYNVRVAPPALFDDHKLPFGTVLHLERTFSIDGERIVVIHSELHPRAKSLPQVTLENNLSYELLTEVLGFVIERSELSIRAELPGRRIAKELGIRTTEPVVVVRRSTIATGEVPIENAAFYVRSNRYEFVLSIREGTVDQSIRGRHPTPASGSRGSRRSDIQPRSTVAVSRKPTRNR